MPFPFDPSPTTLWTLTDNEKSSPPCEVAFVPNGVQAKVMRDGELLYSRIFSNGDEAWAEEERQGHLGKGGLCRNRRKRQIDDPSTNSAYNNSLWRCGRILGRREVIAAGLRCVIDIAEQSEQRRRT
jgi:hypothetical protein